MQQAEDQIKRRIPLGLLPYSSSDDEDEKDDEPTLVKTLGLLYYQQAQQRFQNTNNPVVKNNSDRSTLSWADQEEDMKDLTMQEAIEKYYEQFEAQKKKNKSTLSFISMLDFTSKNKIIFVL